MQSLESHRGEEFNSRRGEVAKALRNRDPGAQFVQAHRPSQSPGVANENSDRPTMSMEVAPELSARNSGDRTEQFPNARGLWCSTPSTSSQPTTALVGAVAYTTTCETSEVNKLRDWVV
jgi:hypothetical protein